MQEWMDQLEQEKAASPELMEVDDCKEALREAQEKVDCRDTAIIRIEA